MACEEDQDEQVASWILMSSQLDRVVVCDEDLQASQFLDFNVLPTAALGHLRMNHTL